jgi:uncharacterized protein involved in type VI secretion and phage assembly
MQRSLFFGKYRGTVTNNIDPQNLGRVQVSCPAVLGNNRMSWAMPCSPVAGANSGLFAVPPVGANVWVEFEGGEPDYPIWSGCFWGQGQVPARPAVAEMTVIKTKSVSLTISDLPGAGGVTLKVNPPAVATPLTLVLDSTGIELRNGKSSVKLTQASVSINKGSLEVV